MIVINRKLKVENDGNDNNEIQQQRMNNNETLFWKVFRNKFISKLIFNQIETVEWVKMDVSDYNICNRMKFKHITSLGHMIKHKLYQLLACKLEAGEFIEIDETGIKLLFLKDDGIQFKNNEEKNEFILQQLREIGYYRIGDENKIIKLNNDKLTNKEIEQSNKKEAITLLFKYKRYLMTTIDFLSTFFEKYGSSSKSNSNQINTDMIKFIINEPIFIPVTQQTLENAIRFTTPEVVEILIGSLLIQIPEHVKNNSISFAFNNTEHREEMMEFILNQPQLYNIPPTASSGAVKKLKASDGSSTITKSGNGEDDGIVLIDLNHAFTIKSKSVLDKLYELNYIFDNIGSLDNGTNKEFKEFKEFKDIIKYYSSEEMNVYDNYLMLYDEPVDGYDNHQVYNYAIKNQSASSLKYLIDNGFKNVQLTPLFRTSITKQQKLKYKSISNEFIKYYTIGYFEFRNAGIDELIIEYMHSILSNQEYQNVYNSISSNSFRLMVSPNWFDITIVQKPNSKSIIVKDTQTVDLIVENIQFIKLYLGIRNVGSGSRLNNKILFEKCQLLDYAKEVYSSIFNNFNYEYLFTLAIYNCDIDQLKQIRESKYFGIGTRFNNFSNQIEPPTFINGEITQYFPGHVEIPFTFKNKSESDLLQLIDYLNSIDYQYFENNSIDQFIKCICTTTGIEITNLKIKLSPYLYKALWSTYSDSIERISMPKVTLFFLNNVSNDIKNYKLDFSYYQWNQFVNDTLFYYQNRNGLFNMYANYTLFINPNNENGPFYCTSSDSIYDLKLLIEILLNQLDKQPDYHIEPIKTFQNMINFLFQKLIRINGITFNQVNEIYQLISNKWISITGVDEFKFNHSFFHVFYYLGIRSLKFIKLILSIPFVKHVLQEPTWYEYSFHPENEEQLENDNTFSFLDPINVYTYEFIYNSPIQVIFEQLIQDFFSQSLDNHTIDSILTSIIEIREFNLFFSILDKIKQYQQQHQIEIIFSDKLVKCACTLFNDYQFQTFVEFNEHKSIKNSILSHNNDKLLSKNHSKLISSIVIDYYKIDDFKFK